MSQENVEIVRSIYAAWERSDFTSAEWAHPEIEYVAADGPAPGGSTGLAGMAEAFRDWRGGQVTRLVQYLDRAKALETVGLAE